MTDYRTQQRGIYRSRDGVVFGVCQGLADHFDFSVFWVRMALVLMFIFSGFWPVIGVYLIAAFLMKPTPVKPITSDDEREFYHSYVNSPASAAERLKKKFRELDRRIRRMEDEITGREYDWKKRFDAK